jgi:glutamate dehydrogenase
MVRGWVPAVEVAPKVPDLPKPRPYREIFVYSPRVEGIHLRFGPVARGGLRWSDRREDFRTEVLGLVKAQMVKNAVIVPVGAKGGFYPKRPARQRQPRCSGWPKARGLLPHLHQRSLLMSPTTWCRWQGRASRRRGRRDGDDPYLVVAADKGTATFSDTANGIALEHGFWLGDAFVSGGSVGYDHKGMGITARGAWESVKRHFRAWAVDVQKPDFTVRGHRRHVGRRVRQRHAAVAGTSAGRRVRPPPHLHRSESRSGERACRARAPVQAAALELGRLRRKLISARAAACSRAA